MTFSMPGAAIPFAHLGIHPGPNGWEARIWRPDARDVTLVATDGDARYELRQSAPGLFEAPLPGVAGRFGYRLAVVDHAGKAATHADPYDFGLLLDEWDLARFAEGRHYHIAEHLGAHQVTIGEVRGIRFAVWAPAARRVSVIGDWNGFDGRIHPMRRREPGGVWELFIPHAVVGDKYKYEIWGEDDRVVAKADPYALMCEEPPATASIVAPASTFTWSDDQWIGGREGALARPMSIYEVHIGSWRRAPNGDRLSYADVARDLVAHCTKQGFTHVEFLPLAAHPYEGSWGYQGSGWFAPNSRHGCPDDLRGLVDTLHNAGIGVIVDWVPAHFPKDDFALAHFDGGACYEYADPREGEHRDWGTLIFNWRRPEVRNFLIGSALHWVREFHIDGLRVDAVSSMLYRNYSREEGEWVANEHGGNANLEAVDLLKEFNFTIHDQFPGVVTIAEESTAWQDITTGLENDGLGFDLKWNMGWMHDTLRYLKQDPVMRPGCHDWMTFHQWYAYDERWVLPLSHDEVVHGKGSLIGKLPGDFSAQLAQLRLLLGYQVAVPGRPLLFQGGEWGQGREWAWQQSADWHEADTVPRQRVWLSIQR